MSNETETRSEGGTMELVASIIADIQNLVEQKLALFRHELRLDIGRLREASFLIAGGLGILLMGGVLVCQMLVHLLAWMAPGIPLWGCYGIVGAPAAILGGIFCLIGIRKFNYLNALSVEPAQDIRENVDG